MTVDEQIAAYVAGPVGSVADLIALQARAAPGRTAVIDDRMRIPYADFDAGGGADAARRSVMGERVVRRGAIAKGPAATRHRAAKMNKYTK